MKRLLAALTLALSLSALPSDAWAVGSPAQGDDAGQARELVEARHWQHALAALEKGPAPKTADDWVLRARVQRGLRNWPAAVEAYDAALALAPGDGALLLDAGLARMAAGDYGGATLAFDKAGSLDGPSSAWARIWTFVLHRLDLVRSTERGPDGLPVSPTAQFRAWLKDQDAAQFTTRVGQYVLGPQPNEKIEAELEREVARRAAAGEDGGAVNGLVHALMGARCEMIGLDGYSGNFYREVFVDLPHDAPVFEFARARFTEMGHRLRLTPELFFRMLIEETEDGPACVVRFDNEDCVIWRMGLHGGDRVVAFEGLPDACDVYATIVSEIKPGDLWLLEIERNGERREQAVVVDVRDFRMGQAR